MGFEQDHALDKSTRGPAESALRRPVRGAPRRAVVQADLVVGPGDDPLEHEADRVAAAVVRSLSLDTAFSLRGAPTRIRRAPDRSGPVVGRSGGIVDGDLAGRIRRSDAGGQPLVGAVRTGMEAAFGTDLGRVRLHTGRESADLSAQLGAHAFTYGRDIHLGAGTPALDSTDGAHLLAHELTHVVQQRDGRIQRLVDRTGLIAKAGAPLGNVGPLIKRSVEYKAILDLLDDYHAENQRVWTANATADIVTSALEPLLDQLATACWAYVQEQGDESDRTPHIRQIVNEDIPAERRKLKAITSGAGFAGLDRTKPMGHVGKPAKVTGVGVDVGTCQVPDPQEGGMADCHSMEVWVDIDAGDRPEAPPGAPPNSIHGVTIEYWENVEIAYNFKTDDAGKVMRLKARGEGASVKAWNDIMAMAPDAATFTKSSGSIQMTWPNAVTAAMGGGLVGMHRVGFRDNPGVTPLAGKHIKRILRFRIVVKDATGQQEILATQVIETDGTTVPVSMTYVDSKGTKVGKVRAADPRSGADTLTDMAQNDALLAAHDVTPAVLAASVPAGVRASVKPFVRELLAGTALPFVNKELDNVRAKMQGQADAGAYKAYSRMGKKKYGTASDYYEIAGMNALPYPEPGTTYYQFPTAGLLVAIMEGTSIRRMYYTPNTSRKVGAQQVRVRSFAELPIEGVLAYVPEATAYLAMPPTERLAYDQIAAAEAVSVRQRAAATGAMAQVFAGGAPATLTYLRNHIADYDAIEAEFDRTQVGTTFAELVKAGLDGTIRRTGPTLPAYLQLSRLYPHEKAWSILKTVFVDAFITRGAANGRAAETQFTTLLSGSRAALGASPALIPIVRMNAGNPAALRTAMMQYLRGNWAPSAESDYNSVVPPLNIAGAPATLGELVNEHFLAELGAGGKGLVTYARLAREYPQFEYRLRPAYRFLFGDAELRQVTERLKAGKAAGDVDAGSTANMAAKQAFKSHGPFTLPNFASSTTKAAKFDVSYDPSTSELTVVVKLSFEFATLGQQPAKVKDKEVGKQYGKNAWTDEAKAAFKADLRRSVLGQWNSNSPTIRCTRPGWEDVVAKPVFDIQEVTKGSGQHNHVKAFKAVLEQPDKTAPKILKGGSSGWGSVETILKEFDVADKISDPSVHRYLHQIEKTSHIGPAFTSDNKRLVARLTQYGTIDFLAGSRRGTTDPNRLPILAEELGRLGVPPELAHLHAIEVVGDAAGGDVTLAGKRADTVIRRLQGLGVKHPLTKVVGNAGLDAVTVRAAAPDPQIVDIYDRKWARITAAHEFGHMLGLMDEYYGAKSDAVVKKLISDGLLPPDTRGDHLAANPPKDNEGEAKGQAATMKLLEANDLTTPDFTLEDWGKSTSLMTGGYELWPQHYVTVWEALTKVTAGDIAAKYWKLG